MVKRSVSISKNLRANLWTYGLVVLGFIVIQLLLLTGSISSSLRGQLVPICAYIVMAVSLNLTVGVLGELSLGHAGFMSLGAFSGVVAAAGLQDMIVSAPLRLAISMIAGALIAGLAGFLVGVPALRLRGDYLAIVTLAFGEIIKNIVNILYIGMDEKGLRVSLVSTEALGLSEGGRVITNGPMGAVGIRPISTFIAGFILIVITLLIVLNLMHSRAGRAIMAVRDNRIAAESLGISITRYKLMAFITSAALAGASGVLYSLNFSTIVARKFDFNTSILVLVFVVLGGIGNIRGSIIAATVLTVLPELLRQFNDYRMLIYAIILILVMLATNNETLRSYVEKLVAWIKKIASIKSVKGGTAHGQ